MVFNAQILMCYSCLGLCSRLLCSGPCPPAHAVQIVVIGGAESAEQAGAAVVARVAGTARGRVRAVHAGDLGVGGGTVRVKLPRGTAAVCHA